MLRQSAQRALGAGRGLASSAAAQAAAPALAGAPKPKGLLASIFGSDERVTTPLTDPLPGLVLPAHVAPPKEAPRTEITTLANGFRVASENTPGATATLGIYVDAGSVYESQSNAGVSHLLEYMAFRTTANRTQLRVVREAEAVGASVLASASREQMVYSIDTVRPAVPEALELLADAVLNPKFQGWAVAEQVERMRADVKRLADNPQAALLEALPTVAFTGGLARPLVAPADALGALDADAAAAFYAANYTAPRMVLAGAGVAHAELVALAEPLLAAAAPGAPGVHAEPVSTYVGGDARAAAAGGLTHAVLAFEAAGGWRDLKTSVAWTVLQYLLGGGGSFSSGGPGKGMHSRLYRRVLNGNPWVHNCTAVNSLFNDTGLVGIFASVESGRVEEGIALLCREWAEVATAVPAEELARAKAAAVSAVLMNLESRAVVAEDIGRQVLTYGYRVPVEQFVAAVQALTAGELARAVAAALKSPPTLALLGDVAAAPRYDAVARRFG